MPGSTPSSVSRYRPAILVFTGAAAAYAAWLLYDSFNSPPVEGLRRSNAVRRSNNRARPRNRSQSARTAQQLLAETMPLGEFDFFGHTISLDPRDMLSYQALLELGRELQPDATDDIIDNRIDQLYDLYIDRLLGALSQGRTLAEIPSAELDAILSITDAQLPGNGLTEVLQRLRTRTAIVDMQGRPVDDLGSIPPTEVGDWEDEIVGDAEGQTLQRTLYHIAEDRARHEGIVHRGITCNGCETRPIRGIRWHCANCADFDLCSDCHATNSHVKTHIFYEIRVPAPNLSITRQEPLYPGRPHMMSASVDPKVKRRLVNDTRMEAEEIEGLWDQFTCLATTPWSTDPNAIGWALDRRAFNHAFIPRYSTFKSAPNLIYDRVFSYFDTDHNTLIGFEEFVKGIDGLHATDTHVKLRIVFNGYDVDGDGYISRKDVLRIFRAHYAIEREATRNYLAESAEEMSVRGALEVIQSAQPLGSAFTQGAIEPGEPNWLLRNKPSDDDQIDETPITENRPDTMERGAIIAQTHPRRHDQDGAMLINGALRDRWARRQFYTDEEEGFARPEGAGDDPSSPMDDERHDEYCEGEKQAHEQNEPPTPESERPRWSRSSSRVRFQDDIDVETRSNASTSSRPVGERWGGYEIPEPEKDLGKEVLYQITQQAFNELLDPLFKTNEDDAMKAYAWRDERRRHIDDIDAVLEDFSAHTDLLRRMLRMGVFAYVNCVVKAFHSRDWTAFQDSQPLTSAKVDKLCRHAFDDAETSIFSSTEPWDEDSHHQEKNKLWTMMLYRAQLLHEITSTVKTLLERRGWLSNTDGAREQPRSPPVHQPIKQSLHIQSQSNNDPIFPQFRPNSLKEMRTSVIAVPDSIGGDHEDVLSSKTGLGPLFVLPRPTSAPSPSDNKPANEVGTAPYTIDEHGITLSRPFALPDGGPHPIMHIFYFDQRNGIADETRLLSLHPSFNPDAPRQDGTFDRSIIAAANDEELSAVNPHLRLVALALIESIDRRDNERKGAGKISFEEFEQAAMEGRMRFLESWMDWVSF